MSRIPKSKRFPWKINYHRAVVLTYAIHYRNWYRDFFSETSERFRESNVSHMKVNLPNPNLVDTYH